MAKTIFSLVNFLIILGALLHRDFLLMKQKIKAQNQLREWMVICNISAMNESKFEIISKIFPRRTILVGL